MDECRKILPSLSLMTKWIRELPSSTIDTRVHLVLMIIVADKDDKTYHHDLSATLLHIGPHMAPNCN